jgi:phage tail protein X
MIMTEYITKPGDRWDLIAYKAYGTMGFITLEDGEKVNAISHIIGANPDIEQGDQLAEGLLLNVPIIPDNSVKTNTEDLPPWK